MRFDVAQVVGAVLMVVCGQGAIRLLIDHGDTGVLGWVAGGFTPKVVVYTVARGGGGADRLGARPRDGVRQAALDRRP